MAASSKAPVLGAVVVAITAAVVVVVLACGRGGGDVRVTAPGAPACAALGATLDDAWHPAARRALLARNPRATTSAAWLADVIDHDAMAWPRLRRAVCGQPGGELAARCLGVRRAALAHAILAGPLDANALVATAVALRAPATCVGAAPLAGLPPDLTLAAIERALPALRASSDPRALLPYARALTRAAALQTEAGRVDAALSTAQSALIVQERIYGTADGSLLALLELIGGAQRALGQLDEARLTRERARQIALVEPAARASSPAAAQLGGSVR